MSGIITLPGLIDIHVHLRDPGQTHKEDFYTGTSAALAGGFTTVLDMPNNAEPIITAERLAAKIESAKNKIVCDIGFHYGTLGDNFQDFEEIIHKVTGLKVYLNATTGNFVIDHKKLAEIYEAWPGDKPILLHAEDDVAELVTTTLKNVPKPTHICHVSSRAELEFVMRAKDLGLPITCGVTPHHLFLNADDEAALGPYGLMKPSLKPKADQNFLWEHMDAIDVIESDHAPHTRQEKSDDPPPYGVPGLETTLSLLLTAEHQAKFSRQQLLDRLYFNPAKIFNIATDETTQVDVAMKEYEIQNEGLKTKCGWSPFAGRRVLGQVIETRIRGETVYKDGEIVVQAGSGNIIS